MVECFLTNFNKFYILCLNLQDELVSSKLESANYLQEKVEETRKFLNMKSKSNMEINLIWTKRQRQII